MGMTSTINSPGNKEKGFHSVCGLARTYGRSSVSVQEVLKTKRFLSYSCFGERQEMLSSCSETAVGCMKHGLMLSLVQTANIAM